MRVRKPRAEVSARAPRENFFSKQQRKFPRIQIPLQRSPAARISQDDVIVRASARTERDATAAFVLARNSPFPKEYDLFVEGAPPTVPTDPPASANQFSLR